MDREFLSKKFAPALPYGRYLATGTAEQQRRWTQVHDASGLTPEQARLVSGFTRDMKVLVVSGIWCGDCVQQCPLMQRIGAANPSRIDLRLLDRDQNRDLADRVHINGGDRVPVALFLSEDFELCSTAGDRTVSRYRAMARKQLGASCPVGLSVPDAEETAATLRDWLDEFERVQLMLRLSARLRQKHGD